MIRRKEEELKGTYTGSGNCPSIGGSLVSECGGAGDLQGQWIEEGETKGLNHENP